ncbi:MAG: PilT protein domain protein [Candidatus Woesebacteria bacterium GW2011_GWB1_38_8]|uniref:PilT protein domain protein n=1 Tax=Candidatus Woesebacteria bacterium GW2011_GWB1_38_8 TaxID=1618570 RepID=A0A0G0NET7_9BACT|nr:MAG: PilT protein domain protein [Candidatus Woesebacteria bacterium GW2011_GWB1_38_8]
MSNVPIVTIDSMVFIYLFEEDPRYIEKIKHFFEQMEKGKLNAITSMITPLEVLSAPRLEKDIEKTLAFTRFFQKTPNLTIYPIDWEIAQKASEIRRQNRYLKTPDSIQIATALIYNSKIFITNDQKLKNIKIESLKIILVDEIGKLNIE